MPLAYQVTVSLGFQQLQSTHTEFPGPECTWDCLTPEIFLRRWSAYWSSAIRTWLLWSGSKGLFFLQENGAMMN